MINRFFVIAILVFASLAQAQPTTARSRPLPVPSQFSDSRNLAIDFAPGTSGASSVSGMISMGGSRSDRKFPFQARIRGNTLSGSFTDDQGQAFPFTAEFDGSASNPLRWSLRFHTGRTAYALSRQEGMIGIMPSEGPSDRNRIVEVLRDTPASKAGLRAGDLIIAVDGRPCSGHEDRESFGVVGEVGAPVRLTVRHADETVSEYTLIRVLNENPPPLPPSSDDGNDRDK